MQFLAERLFVAVLRKFREARVNPIAELVLNRGELRQPSTCILMVIRVFTKIEHGVADSGQSGVRNILSEGSAER